MCGHVCGGNNNFALGLNLETVYLHPANISLWIAQKPQKKIARLHKKMFLVRKILGSV